jgi:hypothetical protein
MADIALINQSFIPNSAIEDIVAEATLPAGDALLLISDPLLSVNLQAIAIPRRHIRDAANIYGLKNHFDLQWECGVIVGEKWASAQPEYPAYFAYLLGHELGHATTMLRDPVLASFEELVTTFIRFVSDGAVQQWHDLPHERRYDQFGVAIATSLFGHERFVEEIASILAKGLSEGRERLEHSLDLRPQKELAGLRGELAAFTLPYRDKLLPIWEGAKQLGRMSALDSIADPASLWSASHAR